MVFPFESRETWREGPAFSEEEPVTAVNGAVFDPTILGQNEKNRGVPSLNRAVEGQEIVAVT
jgi:hypothetical protein